jgi:pimeloyl-ACP methyl ester carboxylesterase
MRSSPPRQTAVVASTLVLALGGCGGSGGPRTSSASTAPSTATSRLSQSAPATTPAPTTIDGCLHADRRTRLISVDVQGASLPAALIGTGPTGVVLANQTDNSACQWLPFPYLLARHGMRVLAFDYSSQRDSSVEVQAAARYLTDHGARHLVLIGASLGGAVVIDAAAHLRPEPDALISLSAVPEATTYPFPADARRLGSPIFHIGGTADPVTRDARDTRALYRASPSPAKRLLLIEGSGHGVDYVGSYGSDQVRTAIRAVIGAHAGGH